MNVESFPESSNVNDHMAEAYLKNGNKEKSIRYYKKSVDLNPGNQNGINHLKELGVDTESMVKESNNFKNTQGIN